MAINQFSKPKATLEKRFAFGILLKRQSRFAGSANLLSDRYQVWGRDPQLKALKGRVCTAADGSLMLNDAQ